MDENHQDKAGSKLVANETKLWLPPTFVNSKAPVALASKKSGINWGFADRTVFDWTILVSQVLGAIAIPFVVTMLGLYLTQQITQQQAQLSASQHQTDLKIAADQQQETILKTCLDDIKDLLLNKSLRASKPNDEVRVVARVEVLAALRQLDGGRKGLLIHFLSEAGLITSVGRDVIIDLEGADLNDAHLEGAHLEGAHLEGAQLNSADLKGAYLESDFGLRGAHIPEPDMIAELRGADLEGAYLIDAELNGAHLKYADLRGAKLYRADLRGAYLTDADLSHADLSHASLIYADLNGADLNDAHLEGADLNGADLKGATMPDGTTHP